MATEIRTYKKLEAWQRGIQLVLKAYKAVEKLPSTEKHELSAQIRRAAVSIPANNAEGHERRGKGYVHHLRIALGSLSELETHIEVAVKLHFVTPEDVDALTSEASAVAQMVHGLRRSVKRRLAAQKASAAIAILLTITIALL